MSVIANISIPAEEFSLGDVLEVREGVKIRLEATIPTGQMTIPYFWVKAPDAAAVETTLRSSALVENVRVLDSVNDEKLFRVDWSRNINGLIESISEYDVAVLAGEGHGDHWSFQLRFRESDDLSEFYRALVEKGISVELEGVHNPVDSTRIGEFGLTDEQREALAVAFESGYFAVPRQTSLVELAEELGISDSAVSQRIRRGLSKIVSATIGADRSGP